MLLCMSFKERDFQTLFGKYLKEKPPLQSEVYELKVCKNRSIPFDAVAEHQEEALLDAISERGVYHKISDQPFIKGHAKMRYTIKKPFDCCVIKAYAAFVVVLYYQPRQPKNAILIDIRDWIKERETCGRKSLHEERAKYIASVIIPLK